MNVTYSEIYNSTFKNIKAFVFMGFVNIWQY